MWLSLMFWMLFQAGEGEPADVQACKGHVPTGIETMPPLGISDGASEEAFCPQKFVQAMQGGSYRCMGNFWWLNLAYSTTRPAVDLRGGVS